jgi:hypothetical protein
MIFVVQRVFFSSSLLPGVFRPANNMLVVRLVTELCVLPSRVEIFKIRQHCVFLFISYRRVVMWVQLAAVAFSYTNQSAEIPRIWRFCQLRISSFRDFPFVSSFVSLSISAQIIVSHSEKLAFAGCSVVIHPKAVFQLKDSISVIISLHLCVILNVRLQEYYDATTHTSTSCFANYELQVLTGFCSWGR